MRVKVQLFNQSRPIEVETDATIGAVVGWNLRWRDGTLVSEEALRAALAGGQGAPGGGGGSVSYTAWRLVREIPAPVTALAKVSGTGLYAITGDGQSATRVIRGADGEIEVSNGGGVGGDPALSLADVPDAGGGALQRTAFDGKGRKIGTSDATTDDLEEGDGNLYFTDERAQDAVGAVVDGSGDVELAYEASPARRLWARLSTAIADLINSALQPGDNVSELANDAGYVDAASAGAAAPVQSVNGETGAVELSAGDVGADASGSAAAALSAATAYADGKVVDSIADGDTTRAPSRKAVFDALAGKEPTLPSGTSGQFYRGDKIFSDTLTAPLIIDDGSAKVQIGNFASARVMFDDVSAPGSRYGLDAFGGSFRMFNDVTNFPLLDISADPFGSNPNITSFMDFIPHTDNLRSMGRASNRWAVIYSASGAINTSDAREKTAPRDMASAEIACALDIARLPCIFQWLEAIAEKGDEARLHCGPTVQAVIATMETHGLDPFRYSFVCYDEWPDQPEIVQSWNEERDEDGNVTREAGSEIVQEYRPAGDRYSLRPTDLAHFVMRGLAHRQDDLDARLRRIESARQYFPDTTNR